MAGEMKYQFNLFCGQQSYIFRTNSKAEAVKFSGMKLTKDEAVLFLQNLHLKMGTYDIPMAAKPKEPKKKPEKDTLSFKEQLKAKAKGKELKKIEKMTEKQAQTELFNKLRGKK